MSGKLKVLEMSGILFVWKCGGKYQDFFSSGYSSTKYQKQLGNLTKIPKQREQPQREQILLSFPMVKNNTQK